MNIEYQRRSVVVFISTVVGILLFTFMINIFEASTGQRFIDHLFEVTSAFTTVGLSTGITGDLSDPSLLVLCACMIIGRPGPLLFLMALVCENEALSLNTQKRCAHRLRFALWSCLGNNIRA